MILIQSYSSPTVMSADYGVYEVLKEHYPEMRTIWYQTPKVSDCRIKKILTMALKSNLMSRRGDTILNWGGDSGVYAWAIGRLLGLNRKYYSQNLIFREFTHLGLKGKVRYWLYKKALHSDNFAMTVNSEPLIEFYAKMFGCSKVKFTLVYDNRSLDESDTQTKRDTTAEPYVFCGGKAARDVEAFVDIVKRMPNVQFKCVFSKEMLIEGIEMLPNLEVYSNLSSEDFYRIANNATVCCIPLKSMAPCGLYVMQHMVLMGIPIVSTETPSMRTVIPDDNCGYLLPMGDVDAMSRRVQELLDNENLRQRMAEKALASFDKFTPKSVGKQLCKAIDRFNALEHR